MAITFSFSLCFSEIHNTATTEACFSFCRGRFNRRNENFPYDLATRYYVLAMGVLTTNCIN